MQELFDEWKVAYLAKGGRKITPREEELFNDFIRWSQWKAAEHSVHPTNDRLTHKMTRYLSEEEPAGKPTITSEEVLKNLKNKLPRNHGKTIQVNKAELELMKLEILTLRKENIELRARLDTNRAQVKAMATKKRRRTSRAADGATCPDCQAKSVIVGTQCLVCGVFSPRR